MKKAMSIWLIAVLLLSLSAITPLSGSALSSGDFAYTVLADQTAQITGYNGTERDVVIPSSVSGYTVTGIGEKAFYNNTSVLTVTIPDSVTSIGSYAFYCCTSLHTVTLPKSLTAIPDFCFFSCNALTDVLIPDTVTSIGTRAFSYCRALISVTIPASVERIGKMAFTGCLALEQISVDSANRCYDSRRYCNAIIETATGKLISACNHTVIPGSVTIIGESAFELCQSMTSIAIPDSVKQIDKNAFAYCSGLTSVAIPDSVTYIGNNAFVTCSSLKSILIPASVTRIGSQAFLNCPSDLAISGYQDTAAERYASSNSIMFRSLGQPLYYYEILADHTAMITKYNGSEAEVEIPASIDGYKVTVVTGFSFNKTVTKVTIPDTVTAIKERAFIDCFALTSVFIGKSVSSIDDYCFNETPSLTSITVDSDNPYFDSRDNCNAVIRTGDNCLIAGSNETVIPDTVTAIGMSAFSGKSLLTHIDIPDSVKTIGSAAFSDNTRLQSVTIGSDVETIGDFAFIHCSSLKTIDLPDSVTQIGESAFESCTSLERITFGRSLTDIGDGVFYECTSLTEVMIPDSVRSIGDDAFYGCTGLKSIAVPESVTSIGEKALGYYFEDNCTKCVDGFTVYGYAGSEAQRYADENGFAFVELDTGHGEDDFLLGDADGAFSVAYLNKKAADVDADEDVTIMDATKIQRFLVGLESPENIGQIIT